MCVSQIGMKHDGMLEFFFILFFPWTTSIFWFLGPTLWYSGLNLGSSQKNHSWQCLGYRMWNLGSNSGLPCVRQVFLPTVLSLQSQTILLFRFVLDSFGFGITLSSAQGLFLAVYSLRSDPWLCSVVRGARD